MSLQLDDPEVRRESMGWVLWALILAAIVLGVAIVAVYLMKRRQERNEEEWTEAGHERQ
jgi:cytochrome c-type biogenesis protein CcmH/NrfF